VENHSNRAVEQPTQNKNADAPVRVTGTSLEGSNLELFDFQITLIRADWNGSAVLLDRNGLAGIEIGSKMRTREDTTENISFDADCALQVDSVPVPEKA
jgi:hypothetical protein